MGFVELCGLASCVVSDVLFGVCVHIMVHVNLSHAAPL